jgi:hypothetical protein
MRLVTLMLIVSASCCAAGDDLVGHWNLAQDARDHSGSGHHAHRRGLRFADGAAVFDGRRSRLFVDDAPGLALGRGDFTVALWLHTDERLTDVIGDLVSQFDPVTRRGFSLSVVNHAGMTSSQSNYRHLQFGLHDGDTGDGAWTDCGRPGQAAFVSAMTIFGGNLYVGTYEHAGDSAGHVFRYEGDGQWADCGSPDRANTVMSLAVYNGNLYAGTCRYNAKGSLLPASPNTHPGGHVYRMAGDGQWEDCGRLGEANDVYCLCVFDGALYANPMYSPGVFRYDGARSWLPCGIPGGLRSMSLAVYNGHLYNSGNGSAGVWRYEGGDQWADCGKQAEETQTYSFAIHEGRMLVGTWPSGSVFRHEGGRDWQSLGRLGEEKEVMGLALYNGELYGGTLPLAQVYRYRGPNDWLCTGQLDSTPDVTYRRAWTMAVHGGKLYCGTLPSGHVFSLQSGQCASHDDELPPGWRHVAAVRAGKALRLHLDGKQIATTPVSERLDLTSGQPLQIGFGSHDYFHGRMRDVRLYRRALTAAQVKSLARP